MSGRDVSLLEEIERDVLDGKPLADLLRKCVMLGGRAGSVALREWAGQELRGYSTEADLPDYRTIHAAILLDAVTGSAIIKRQRISVTSLPEFVQEHVSEDLPLLQGVGELEALVNGRASDDAINLSLPGAAEIARWMNSEIGNPYQQIQGIYWSVVPAVIRGTLDQVRTSLTELVSELVGTMQTTQGIPTAEQANQAVQVAVHGRKSQVTVTTAQASGNSRSSVQFADHKTEPTSEPAWWTLGRKLAAFIVGLAIILGTLISYLIYVK